MQKYLLSICIPTFNRKESLGRLLESLFKQCENKDVEIVISDNASTDGTDNLCHELTVSKSDFKYRRQVINIGYAGNLLSALKLANGRYLWMLGDDDFIHPQAVDIITSFIDRNHPTLLMCNFARINSSDEDWRSCREFKVPLENVPAMNLDALLQRSGMWASFMSINVISSRALDHFGDNISVDLTSDYLGFDITLHAGSMGMCSLIAEPIIARIKQPLTKHRFSSLDTYAFSFFNPLNRLVAQGKIKASTRNKIANQMYLGMVGYLLLKSRVNAKSVPLLRQWIQVHKAVPVFWVTILPLLFLPRWLLHSLISTFRFLNKARGNSMSKMSRFLDALLDNPR